MIQYSLSKNFFSPVIFIFEEINKFTLTFKCKYRKSRIKKTIFKKNKVGGFILGIWKLMTKLW